MSRRAVHSALATMALLSTALTTACVAHSGSSSGADRREESNTAPVAPASGTAPDATITVAPEPSVTGLSDLTHIVDDAQSAAAAADSDAAEDN
ncbi:hypothetical protein [Streptomyces griseorubiginosus]|uniref:hypothetical protein n=1 Tax=Streptomyces griseorubiginosus TaxID=67304 RepID=UPI0036E254B6